MLVEGLKAGSERLASPAVADADERARQGRLLALLLAGPFFAFLPLAQSLGPQLGLALTLAVSCAVFGAAWAVAAFVAATGRGRIGEWMGAALALAVLALIGAGAGDMASPLLLLVFVAAHEAYRISGNPRAAAAMAVVAGGIMVVGIAGGTAVGWHAASAWHWLAPVAYGVFACAAAFRPDAARREIPATEREWQLLERLDALSVELTEAGDVARATGTARDLLGVAPGMLHGQGLFERIHVADRVAWLCALAAMREGESAKGLEVRIRRSADGGPAAYRRFAVGLLAPGETGGCACAVLRDASALEAAREALERSQARVDEIEIAKSRFLASVSHELRTPLNAIIGFSEMLLQPGMSGELSSKQNEQVGLIREAGGHLLSVVNAILDVSRMESGAYRIYPEPFEPAAAMALCRSMLEPQAREKGVTLRVEAKGRLGPLVADQRSFQQILINLVSNAIKFTPQGGDVVMTAMRRDGRLVLRVSDNGIGISATDLERIGRPFVQLRDDYARQQQGSGLGLSIVGGLVELHEGGLSIESAPGLGTTVTVELPLEGPTGQNEHSEDGRKAAPDAGLGDGIHGATLLKSA